MQGARRKKKRGRAAGGILMEVRRGLEGREEIVEGEGLMIREVKWKGEIWKVGTVYIRENVEKIMKKVKEEVDKRMGEKGWILEGDFKSRTGKEGAIEEEGTRRRSLDKIINKQEEELIK